MNFGQQNLKEQDTSKPGSQITSQIPDLNNNPGHLFLVALIHHNKQHPQTPD